MKEILRQLKVSIEVTGVTPTLDEVKHLCEHDDVEFTEELRSELEKQFNIR